MGTGEFNAGGNPAMDWHPIQGGVEIFLVASCRGNRDKLRPDGPLGSYADFTIGMAYYIMLLTKCEVKMAGYCQYQAILTKQACLLKKDLLYGFDRSSNI